MLLKTISQFSIWYNTEETETEEGEPAGGTGSGPGSRDEKTLGTIFLFAGMSSADVEWLE